MKCRFDILIRALGVALVLALAGCNDMYDGARLKPYESTPFFPDQRSARMPVPGTVARGLLHDDEHLYNGTVNGKVATTFPFPIDREALERGRERFNINCTPCHGRPATGDGMIVQRGYPHPRPLFADALVAQPVGYFFNVITQGFGQMPSYAAQVPPRDRWLIVAYIRTIQESHNVPVADLPADVRANLEQEGSK